MIRTLRAAISTFTLLPVGRANLSPEDGATLLLWFPLIGLGLGAVAGLVIAAALGVNGGAGLLAAVLGIGSLALLTRGLHLDGLADTADGLGSRAPAEPALEIMRRSDIGPFGVVTIVIALGIDIAAIDMFTGSHWHALAALTVAAAAGRLAVVHAALPGIPSARPGGFGALVAGRVSPVMAAAETVAVLGLAAGLAAAIDINPLKWTAAVVVALGLAAGFRWHVTRRLGGVTGDVFGALVEIGTALTLIGLALST